MNKATKILENSKKTAVNIFLIAIGLFSFYLAPTDLFALEQNTDRPGGDFHHFPLASPDPALCEKMCREGSPLPYSKLGCKAFTYVKPTTTEPNGVCWLKKEIPSPVANSCCVSGVARRLICVHGNSGEIQDKQVSASQYGSGLSYDVVGIGSWLHYSIPTSEGDTWIEGIQLKFTITNPKYGWLAAVHVYDGDVSVERFDNQIYGKKLASEEPTTVDLLLPLSGRFRFGRGVGISILPQAQEAAGLVKVVNMQVHSVCALVTASP